MLTFQDQTGERIGYERIWHFTDAGRLRPGEGAETVRIMKGLAREVIGRASEADPQGAASLLDRSHLHVSVFGRPPPLSWRAASAHAERDTAVQGRDGIEAAGLDRLRP